MSPNIFPNSSAVVKPAVGKTAVNMSLQYQPKRIYFTQFSSEAAWLRLHTGLPITKKNSQYSQRYCHPQFRHYPQCPHRQPLQLKTIHCQTRLLTQRQRLLHWWHNSHIKMLQWWLNSNTNHLCHWSLPHILTQPTKYSAPHLINEMGLPQQNQSSPHKLQLKSPRHTMQASNIGIKQQQIPNTRASQLAPACSPPYLFPSIQCLWTMPDLLPIGLPCFHIFSLILNPSPAKISLSQSHTSLASKC